jgi:hypothetical protein
MIFIKFNDQFKITIINFLGFDLIILITLFIKIVLYFLLITDQFGFKSLFFIIMLTNHMYLCFILNHLLVYLFILTIIKLLHH